MRILILTFATLFSLSNPLNIPDGFVYLKDIDNEITVDLKYYSKSNFTGKFVDGYYSNNAILTDQAAIALVNAQKDFKKLGFSLIIFDAYRPQSAVDFFVQWSKDINDTINKNVYYPNINKSELFDLGYIAYKSGHSRGSTVDVSLIDLSNNIQIDMGSIYDFFGPESSTLYSNISEKQQYNRSLLNDIMLNNGFKNYSKEWWHFTLEDEPFDKYFNFLVK
tara:strand:+ start:145 stop:807 length:663 start_codon:yes stop_codon:yes gene_type:complete